MNSSGYWDQSSFQRPDTFTPGTGGNTANSAATNGNDSYHQVQVQGEIPQDELLDSIASANASEYNQNHDNVDNHGDSGTDYDIRGDDLGVDGFSGMSGLSGEMVDDDDDNVDIRGGDHSYQSSNNNNLLHLHLQSQPSLEQIQRVYFVKGLEELESLQLLDLSPLANWKLSSLKLGFSLRQLLDDSPDSFWQSDGSNGNGAGNNSNGNNGNGNGTNNNNNNGGITNANNELTNPHSITIQFSKKVSIERISIFTNFSIDESYTPSKIQILAGLSDCWDLSEVCVVSFNKPIGWSHIIFNGIRSDSVLKCFIIKLVILSNHQDGKDTHIRAVKVFGSKGTSKTHQTIIPEDRHQRSISLHSDILKDLSTSSGLSNMSGILLNKFKNHHLKGPIDEELGEDLDIKIEEEGDANGGATSESYDEENITENVISIENVNEVIGFNTGFQSIDLKSVSSIR